MREKIKEYFEKEIEVIRHLDAEEIEKAVQAIRDAYEREAVIYVFGNGGSAATASHYVCDFDKGLSMGRKKKFRMVCLSDNTPLLTALANDISYEDVFRFQLEGVLKPEDLVIAISGSGNSRNVIKAVEYAKSVGTKVVGITGYDGGQLKKLSDYHMDAGVKDMQIAEDIHMIFDHMMYFVLSQELAQEG